MTTILACENLKNFVMYYLERGRHVKEKGERAAMKAEKSEPLEFKSPVDGRVTFLAETPDVNFAQEKMGCGVTIFPTNNTVCAPTDGRIMMIFPGKHAVGIETPNGVEYLIHIGIDTVHMHGDGFVCLVKENQEIHRGENLLIFDKKKIISAGYSDAIPIVFTNISKQAIRVTKGGIVKTGDTILEIIDKPDYL